MQEDEPIELPITDVFDLHAVGDRDFRAVAEAYLEEAYARGYREVRVIHGRGTGTRRAVIRRLLAGHPLVLGYRDAPPESGGWGATLVYLVRD